MLTWLAAAALTGSWIGTGDIGVPAAVAVGAGGTAGLALAVAAGSADRRRALLALTLTVLTTAVLGGARVALQEGGPLAALARDGGSAVAVATVVSEPRPVDDGWWAVVRVERLDGTGVRARALLRRSTAPPAVGSRWAGTVTARPVEREGFGNHLRTLHAAVEISPRRWRLVDEPSQLLRSVETVRSRVRAAAARRLPAGPAGLAAGLVTGDTRLLPRPIETAMRDTGLSHLTAVSGSNVAVVVAGVGAGAALLGLGARGRRRLIVAAVVWFVVLTRAEPSVLRAAVMVGMVLAAEARGVGGDAVDALAGAVLLLVLADPFLARSVGLLLSAAATAGVLVLAPMVRARLRAAALPGRVADLLAVTVGAQIAVVPVLLARTGSVPAAAVAANVVAVPAAALASIIAGGAALLAPLHVGAAGALMQLARPPLTVILWAARTFRGRFGEITTARPLTVVVGTVLIAWLLARPGSRLSRLAAGASTVALLGVLVVARLVGPGPVRTLTVTAIDVGQGDAVLVEAPGVRILVDGGPDSSAASWLARAGRTDLDLLVLSHPHADHLDGLPEVLRRSRVGALWLRPVPTGLASLDRLLTTAAAEDIPVARPAAGDVVRLGEVRVEVLHPPPGRPYRWTDAEANDTSLVLRVSWRGRAALLTGDVEEPAQRDLLAAAEALRADVLKVPHHGAGTTEASFLAATGARDAIISVGADNRYGHPHPSTLAALVDVGMRIHRTDRDGTVRLEVAGSGPEAVVAPSEVVLEPGIASQHAASRHPRRRRRRPPPAARDRAGAVGAAPGRARSRRRGPRRPRGRSPPGDAHGLAVRGDLLCGAPGCGATLRHAA